MSIQDFEFLGKLGQGSYSTVFKAKRHSDNQTYAVKKVKYASMSSKERQCALNEIRILASVDHPNVISYKESLIDERTNSLSIVMEYAEKGDLYQKVKTHRARKTTFPEEEIWSILKQCLMGLQALHSLGILHRDIKNANIFLSDNGKIKLGDLNVAKVAGFARTQTGTPYYASPEIWNDYTYNSKSDIWSLGCSIYELAALDVPFKANNMKALCNKICVGKYPALPNCYSEDLRSIIRNMLQVNPKRRSSCAELLKSNLLTAHVKVEESEIGSNNELISTIRLPLSMRGLKKVLPGPLYHRRHRSIEKENKNIPEPSSTPTMRIPLKPVLVRDCSNIFKDPVTKSKKPSYVFKY